jgi:glycosyltransferase involved in cell wall biosynthesis
VSLRVSVVICTFNRGHLLPRLIDRVDVELGDHDGEIIVVNNASTDATSVVLKRAAARHSRLQVIEEPRSGLSNARNAGVRASSGEVVVFLDDDALPASRWLDEHLAEYDDGDDRLGAVGGRIELLFEPTPRPRWLSPRFDSMLGRYDLGGERRPYDDGLATPPGGNMSFRRTALDGVGEFDVSLGRVRETLSAGEEFELVHRLYRAGWSAMYNPAALAFHLVPPQRLRPRYYRQRLLENWRSSRRLGELAGEPHSRILGAVLRSAAHDAFHAAICRSFPERVYFALRTEAHLRYLGSVLADLRKKDQP